MTSNWSPGIKGDWQFNQEAVKEVGFLVWLNV
jgi:hypothetical protein